MSAGKPLVEIVNKYKRILTEVGALSTTIQTYEGDPGFRERWNGTPLEPFMTPSLKQGMNDARARVSVLLAPIIEEERESLDYFIDTLQPAA